MKTRSGLVLLCVSDLTEEEEASLRSKIDALVEGVRIRRLPFPNIRVDLVQVQPDDVVLAWADDLDETEVQELQDQLAAVLPVDTNMIVSNFETNLNCMDPETMASFRRALNDALDENPATKVQQDALEALREVAWAFTKLVRDGVSFGLAGRPSVSFTPEALVRVSVEDVHPENSVGQFWRVAFTAEGQVVWEIETASIDSAAECAVSFVSSVGRIVGEA